MLHCKHLGLNHIYLNNGFEIHQYGNDQGLSIKDITALFDLVAHCIVNKKGPIARNEFLYLCAMMDQSPADIGKLMGVSGAYLQAKTQWTMQLSTKEDNAIRSLYLNYAKAHNQFLDEKYLPDLADVSDEVHLLLEHLPIERTWRVKSAV